MIDEEKLLEKIKENSYLISYGTNNREEGMTLFGIEQAIKQQPKIRDWIPCSERLPKRFEDVLIWYKGKTDGGTCDGEEIEFYGIGYLAVDSWVISTYKSIRKERYVIAWQPLPKPYKENI